VFSDRVEVESQGRDGLQQFGIVLFKVGDLEKARAMFMSAVQSTRNMPTAIMGWESCSIAEEKRKGGGSLEDDPEAEPLSSGRAPGFDEPGMTGFYDDTAASS